MQLKADMFSFLNGLKEKTSLGINLLFKITTLHVFPWLKNISAVRKKHLLHPGF